MKHFIYSFSRQSFTHKFGTSEACMFNRIYITVVLYYEKYKYCNYCSGSMDVSCYFSLIFHILTYRASLTAAVK